MNNNIKIEVVNVNKEYSIIIDVNNDSEEKILEMLNTFCTDDDILFVKNYAGNRFRIDTEEYFTQEIKKSNIMQGIQRIKDDLEIINAKYTTVEDYENYLDFSTFNLVVDFYIEKYMYSQNWVEFIDEFLIPDVDPKYCDTINTAFLYVNETGFRQILNCGTESKLFTLEDLIKNLEIWKGSFLDSILDLYVQGNKTSIKQLVEYCN